MLHSRVREEWRRSCCLMKMTYIHSLSPNSVATGQEEAQKKKVDEWKAKFQSLTEQVNEAETARDVEMAKQRGLQLELEQTVSTVDNVRVAPALCIVGRSR